MRDDTDTRPAIYIDHVTGQVRVADDLRDCKFSDVTIDGWHIAGSSSVVQAGVFDVRPWEPGRIAAYAQALARWRRRRVFLALRRLTSSPAARSMLDAPWLIRQTRRIASRVDSWLSPPVCLHASVSNVRIDPA